MPRRIAYACINCGVTFIPFGSDAVGNVCRNCFSSRLNHITDESNRVEKRSRELMESAKAGKMAPPKPAPTPEPSTAYDIVASGGLCFEPDSGGARHRLRQAAQARKIDDD